MSNLGLGLGLVFGGGAYSTVGIGLAELAGDTAAARQLGALSLGLGLAGAAYFAPIAAPALGSAIGLQNIGLERAGRILRGLW